MHEPRVRRYVEFYLYHFILLVAGCFAYLFTARTELLDWTLWLPASVALIWVFIGSPLLGKLIGHDLFRSYRAAFVRSTSLQWAGRIAIVVVFALGFYMFKELYSRFKYVETVKALTIDKGSESLPHPTPGELAAAYTLYPHRKEVLFIVNRMSRLLAFDDQTGNFNRFIDAFLAKLDVDAIVRRYASTSEWQQYEGSIDPVLAIARLHVETTKPIEGLRTAIALIDKYRATDHHARFYRVIYEHDLISASDPAPEVRAALDGLRRRVSDTLTGLHQHPADDTKTPIKLATTHAFQELLDHFAQLHMETTNPSDPKAVEAAIKQVPQLYSRVLTVRQNVANATDVPWLESAGKFTLYHYFKHAVGRHTDISVSVRAMMTRIPGLADAMDKTVIGAEAFKEFRDLGTWDRGTPLSSAFAGTGMHRKLMEWLKSGW